MAAAFTVTNTPVGTYPGSGGTPGVVVIQADSRDNSLLVMCPTGSVGGGGAPVAGLLCTIAYDANYTENVTGRAIAAAPPYSAIDVPVLKAIICPIGAVAKNADVYITNGITPNSIPVAVKNAPAASLAATLALGICFVIYWDG